MAFRCSSRLLKPKLNTSIHTCIHPLRSPVIRPPSFRQFIARSVSNQIETPTNLSRSFNSPEPLIPPDPSKLPQHLEASPFPIPRPEHVRARRSYLKVRQVFESAFTTKSNEELYAQLSLAPAKWLGHLFYTKLHTVEYQKQLRPVFLKVSSYWTSERIKEIMNDWSDNLMPLRMDLLTQRLLPEYIDTQDIALIIECLPLGGKRDEIMPCYNAVLAQCEHHKYYNHLRLVVDVMKERNIQLDIASYNILLQMSLTKDPDVSGMDMYNKLLSEGFVPSAVTFNILLTHAIQNEQWDTLDQWLDLMNEKQLEPTQVTARILFRALAEFPLQPKISNAFDRVSHTITLTEKEKLINTSASVLIKSEQPTYAIDILRKAFESDEPLSIYTYNLLLNALCAQGQIKEAKQVLDAMISSQPQILDFKVSPQHQIPKPDIISFTTVIHGVIQHSVKPDLREISRLCRQLEAEGLRPNKVLQSAISVGLQKKHRKMRRRGK